jgi:hypothetical protein
MTPSRNMEMKMKTSLMKALDAMSCIPLVQILVNISELQDV